MADEIKPVENAPVVEDNTTVTPQEKPKETMENTVEEKPKRVVPEPVFLEVKNENKSLKKQMAELKNQLERGATKQEIATEVEDLIKEFPDVNPDFLNKFLGIAKSKAKAELEEELRPLKEEKAKESFDKKFADKFKEALEEMPEFKNIADIEVIKALAMKKENSGKTFEDLLEQVYGKFVTRERKTLERITPGGGKDVSVDFKKAQTDKEYFKQVMANPETKKIYNEYLIKNMRF